MSAPLSRIIEGLRAIEKRVNPGCLRRGGAVAREQEGRFLLEMVGEARAALERCELDHKG